MFRPFVQLLVIAFFPRPSSIRLPQQQLSTDNYCKRKHGMKQLSVLSNEKMIFLGADILMCLKVPELFFIVAPAAK
jgi:hypothetical protein